MMCDNVVSKDIDLTLKAFTPKKAFDLLKQQKLERKKIVHPLVY
jgi:hypothetical protein